MCTKLINLNEYIHSMSTSSTFQNFERHFEIESFHIAILFSVSVMPKNPIVLCYQMGVPKMYYLVPNV